MKNKILYKSNSPIGELAAEHDETFLNSCFVSLPIIGDLLDVETSKCIILGRTGSGKTAILNHIESTEENTIRVDPNNVAFDYIANSNVLLFLRHNGFDLRVLFVLLWKHVFLSQAIQVFFENQSKFEFQLNKLFGNVNSDPAREYLDKYQGKFWIEQDEILREISGGFEEKVSAGIEGVIGTDFAKISSGLSNEIKIDANQKSQISARVQSAVSSLQFRLLQRAMETLNELTTDKQKKYYILVDDLDLDWAPDQIKYDLINALVDAVSSFRKVRKVKILAALRTDLLERSNLEQVSDGFQPEKNEGNFIKLLWSERDLKEVVDARINYLFKHKYTKQGVEFKHIFPSEVRKTTTFSYIFERTQRRPRDIIAFMNQILEKSAGTSEIIPKHITDAESTYSSKRLDALYHEWKSVHPMLNVYLNLLKGKSGRIGFGDISEREFVFDLCVNILDSSTVSTVIDSVSTACNYYEKRENPSRRHDVVREYLAVLYKVGAIELKVQANEKAKSCYIDNASIASREISDQSSFRINPMLWRALGITPNIG
ncbi:MAG: hypothetical protein ABJO86_14320 [Lentilitoribacter sp.]